MLIPPTVSAENIRDIIGGLEVYISEKKIELEIGDMELPIVIEEFARDDDGFANDGVNARVVLNENVIQRIEFYAQIIANIVNWKFRRINDRDTFNSTVELYIKFVLIHELVHVQQINRNPNQDQNNTELESEANNIAHRMVSEEGDFANRIMQIVSENEDIDNEIANDLIRFYNIE